MKRLILILIFLLSILVPVQAQVERSQNENPGFTIPAFYIDILSYRQYDKTDPRVDLFVSIPFGNLQFVQYGDYFTAEYQITASIFSEDGTTLIGEKIWTEKIKTVNFDETNAKNKYNLSLRSFYLTPGKYAAKVSIEDTDSKQVYKTEEKVEVRDLNKPISMSDLMLISNKTVVDGNNKLIPNVSKNIAAQKEGIPFFFEVYADSAGEAVITYKITANEGTELKTESEKRALIKGKNQFFYTITGIDMNLGDYAAEFSVEQENTGEEAEAKKSFYSFYFGIPSTFEALTKATDQLLYIASSDDIDSIQTAQTYPEKLVLFMEFWKKRDPTPNTPENELYNEYFRRVDYANKHYKKMFEGWRTDMGMVYIILGPPDNVDRHPFNYDSNPYEVWDYYNLNRQFVFYDYTGFGDYRLLTPFYGDYNYR